MSDLLLRLEHEIIARSRNEKDFLFIFSIGANDSQFLRASDENRVSPEQFKKNTQTMIATTQKFGSKIVFIGVTPADESKVDPIPWNTERSYLNEYIKSYNKIVKTLCKKNNLHYVDIFSKMEQRNPVSLLVNGIHPNDAGHEMIFKIVREYLEENNLI